MLFFCLCLWLLLLLFLFLLWLSFGRTGNMCSYVNTLNKIKRYKFQKFILPAIIWSFTRITVRGTSLSLLMFLFLFLFFRFFFLLASLRWFRPRKFVHNYYKGYIMQLWLIFFSLIIFSSFFLILAVGVFLSTSAYLVLTIKKAVVQCIRVWNKYFSLMIQATCCCQRIRLKSKKLGKISS